MTQDSTETDMPGIFAAGDPETAGARDAARKTLAMRIAHRNRLRAERLARLRVDRRSEDGRPEGRHVEGGRTREKSSPPAAASSDEAPPRTVPGPTVQAETPPKPVSSDAAGTAGDDAAALEEFLRALSQGGMSVPDGMGTLSELEPASVLPFQRPPEAGTPSAGGSAVLLSEPRAAPICDLHRLEGVGPGLIWALQRAGIACMSELAALEAPELASRLGCLGRLVPAEAWVATARRAGAAIT